MSGRWREVRTQADLESCQEAADWADCVAEQTTFVVRAGHLVVRCAGSSSVVAYGSSSVEARGSSRVVARGSSRVVAYESSSVEAYGSSSVEARGSSSVVARGSSSVVAYGSSRVEARGSSRVVAYESSRVEAYESSRVVAYESSRVEAGKYTPVTRHPRHTGVVTGGVLIDLTQLDLDDPETWCDYHGVTTQPSPDGPIALLYKGVNDGYLSDYKTSYAPGTTPEAPDWQPTRECGQGLHFSASPSGTHAYTSPARYLRCPVRLDEMVCLGDKVKARRVVAPGCVEVDVHGDVLAAVSA